MHAATKAITARVFVFDPSIGFVGCPEGTSAAMSSNAITEVPPPTRANIGLPVNVATTALRPTPARQIEASIVVFTLAMFVRAPTETGLVVAEMEVKARPPYASAITGIIALDWRILDQCYEVFLRCFGILG